jgi:hypothetical protein
MREIEVLRPGVDNGKPGACSLDTSIAVGTEWQTSMRRPL